MAIVYVLASALVVSFSNVLGGLAARKMPLAIAASIAGPAAMVIALIVVPLFPGTPSSIGLWLGFAAGLFAGAGLPIAYRAFAIGPVGIAGALLAVVGTVILTVVGVLSGEALTPFRIIGLVLCIIAILLVTYRPPVDGQRASLRGPLLAVIAAVLFSSFVVTINTAPDADGLWPLLAARFGITVVAMVLFAQLLYREGRRTAAHHFRGRVIVIPLAAGALDMLGNVFLVLALQAGDLLLLAILAPAAPIFTAIIGRVFLGERMTRWQILGLGVASGALVLAAV